jgi:hypothetical protein
MFQVTITADFEQNLKCHVQYSGQTMTLSVAYTAVYYTDIFVMK